MKNLKRGTKIPDILSGYVQRRRVRCGKPNCRCARGQLHTAHYHVWKAGGVRFQSYVRRADVAAVRAACDANRRRRAELRAGRGQYARLLAALRELMGG